MPAGKLSGKRILVGRLSGEAANSAGTEGIIISGRRTEGYSIGWETSICSSLFLKRAGWCCTKILTTNENPIQPKKEPRQTVLYGWNKRALALTN